MAEDPKLTEFRENNLKLMQQIEGITKERDDLKAKVEGSDAELVELRKATKPDVRVAELESALAAEKTARAATQTKADALVLETTISDAFLCAGGLPKARAFIVAAASPQFVVEDGHLKGKTFSPNHPGQPMTVDEWVLLQTKENSFCFGLSSGGGAVGNKGGGGAAGGAKELQNPTPQQLGEHAAAIKRGDVKVTYTT